VISGLSGSKQLFGINAELLGESNPMAVKPTQKIAPSARRWASMKEGAEHIGVTVHTIRQMIADGKITGYRVNKRLYRIDLNELDAALQPFGGAA
jgi:excisionase family DNA binding protein